MVFLEGNSYLSFIVIVGFFVRHSFLPLSLAWGAFEKKNGAADFEIFIGERSGNRGQSLILIR